MKQNMGNLDRILRLIVAGVFAWLYFGGIVTGIAGVALLVLGGIFILTSSAGFCPLYKLFNARTQHKAGAK